MSNNLKEKRTAANLSQIGLAIRAGMQPGLVCRYEKGMRPCQRNAMRLAAALDCDVRKLFPDYSELRSY